MTRPKLCQGCQTHMERCYSYIGHKNKPFHRLFRDRFCPCTTCIVKATCQDPKYSQLSYAGTRSKHKCKDMYEGVKSYWEYVSENNIRQTTIKRKKKKRKKRG